MSDGVAHWANTSVAVLVTVGTRINKPNWARVAEVAVRRGVLTRIYVAMLATADTPYQVAELAKNMKTCGTRIVTQRGRHALVKIFWTGKPTAAPATPPPEGQAA